MKIINCRGAIFDMDGTLLDTINDITFHGNLVLEKYGLPVYKTDEYKYFVGEGVKNLVLRMLPQEKRNDRDLYKSVFHDFNESYKEHKKETTKPYDGISELLTSLMHRGIKLAILSNKNHDLTVTLAKKYFPDVEFSSVIGHRDGIPDKPDPGSANEILEIMGLKKDECIYFGDTATDMKTAHNAGITGIGVLWGFREKDELIDAGASIIIKYPQEILQYIIK